MATEQPAVQTPATETAAPVVTQQAEPQTAAQLHDALEAQLSDPNWQPAKAATTETPATETVAEVKAGETPPETPATEPVVDPPEVETPPVDPLPEGIERPRLSDPNDQVIAALKKAQPHLTWAQCEERVMGVTQAKAETPATETAPDPLIALREEMAAADATLKEWGENEGLPNPEIVALIKRRGDLAAEILVETRFRGRDQQTAEERQQAQVAQAREIQQTHVAKATERFPNIGDKATLLGAEAAKLIEEFRGSPFMDRPTAPIELGEIAARNVAQAQSVKNGTSFEAELQKLDTAAKKPATQAAVTTTTPVPVTPQPKITPAGGNQNTRQPDKPATDADRYKTASALTDPQAKQAALNDLLYGT